MAKTSVDIDMEKLDKVRGILGTESERAGQARLPSARNWNPS